VLFAAAWGGEGPGLASDLAAQLAQRADAAAAAGDANRFCAARAQVVELQTRTIAAVNDGLVPAELQEELLGSVNALLDGVTCEPASAVDGWADAARDLSSWVRDRSD
jgi:hypothetical protein